MTPDPTRAIGSLSSLASLGLEAQGSSGATLTNEHWPPKAVLEPGGQAAFQSCTVGEAYLSLGLWEAELQGPRRGWSPQLSTSGLTGLLCLQTHPLVSRIFGIVPFWNLSGENEVIH